jgi:hypothetical protein
MIVGNIGSMERWWREDTLPACQGILQSLSGLDVGFAAKRDWLAWGVRRDAIEYRDAVAPSLEDVFAGFNAGAFRVGVSGRFDKVMWERRYRDQRRLQVAVGDETISTNTITSASVCVYQKLAV